MDANRLEELFKRRVDDEACAEQGIEPIATGLNASPGAATGKVVFSADEAQEWAGRGEHVILVRRETTPDDYHGMIASQGILTSAGGTNSHAAVVARGEGIPAVCGADAIKLDVAAKTFSADGTTVAEGEVITIDGFTGQGVRRASRRVKESELEEARSGDAAAREREDLEGVRGVDGAGGQRSGGCASGRTPTRPTRRRTRASAAPRASASAAPSTCSWARSASRPCSR